MTYSADNIAEIPKRLPQLRGTLRANADLSRVNWFQVGGAAEWLFRPYDTADLSMFLVALPANVPVTVLGVGSNLLVRDGGIDGVVIRLGRGLSLCQHERDRLVVGAGCLNSNAVMTAATNQIGGLEFLSGIPGSIGGALLMNAGAYGVETADVLVEAEAVDRQGKVHIVTPHKLSYTYRHCSLPKGWIFTRATLQGRMDTQEAIMQRIETIAKERADSQPVRSRTGGSTFKNPEGHKAWQLIEAAGCRGLRIADAQMSEKHCNFMLNLGNATAAELEALGELVIQRVFEHSGITLEWEIQRIGKVAETMPSKAVA